MPKTVDGKERHDGITILTVTTPVIDVNVMKEVRAEVSSSDSPKVILVLRLVRQILHSSLYEDQEGLGPLMLLHKQMNRDGRRLVLCDLHPAVREAFDILRLDQWFEIHADAKAAVIAMQQ